MTTVVCIREERTVRQEYFPAVSVTPTPDGMRAYRSRVELTNVEVTMIKVYSSIRFYDP